MRCNKCGKVWKEKLKKDKKGNYKIKDLICPRCRSKDITIFMCPHCQAEHDTAYFLGIDASKFKQGEK